MAKKSKPDATLAIVGLIFGSLSIMSFFYLMISLPFGITGLILSLIQQRREPHGIAKAGMIVSIIGLAITILFHIVMVLAYVGLIAYAATS
ncbi:hypothetical protein GF342_03700 [Candidatus Woesearchaeota archaeon]|nr:hypothetical protein [Candidatus Woesearchaeota archaeon]